MKSELPEGFKSAFDSRDLHHLGWKSAAIPNTPRIVLVRGVTGMREPKHEFIALGFCDPSWHPNAHDHWFDMNNDHFIDQGWQVTHWCDLN